VYSLRLRSYSFGPRVALTDTVSEEMDEDHARPVESFQRLTRPRGVAHALPTKILSPGRTIDTASRLRSGGSRQPDAALALMLPAHVAHHTVRQVPAS
jgi:hypothetical protein